MLFLFNIFWIIRGPPVKVAFQRAADSTLLVGNAFEIHIQPRGMGLVWGTT